MMIAPTQLSTPLRRSRAMCRRTGAAALAGLVALGSVFFAQSSPAAADAELFTPTPPALLVSAPEGSPAVGVLELTANKRSLFRIDVDSSGEGLPHSYDTETVATGPEACSSATPMIIEAGEVCTYTLTQTAYAYIGATGYGTIRYFATEIDAAGDPVGSVGEIERLLRFTTYSNPFSVTPLDFGTVDVGNTATGTVTVTNTTRTDREFRVDLAVPTTGPFRAIPPAGGASATGSPAAAINAVDGNMIYTDEPGEPDAGAVAVAAGESVDIAVTFTPTEIGPARDMFVPASLMMNRVGMKTNPYLVLSGNGQAPSVGLSVVENPQDLSIKAGTDAAFHSAATATSGVNSVQWQKFDSATSDWVDIEGATEASLTLRSVPLTETGTRYRAVWTNDAFGERVLSEAATLTVTAPPVVTPPGTLPPGEVTPPATGQSGGGEGTLAATGTGSQGMWLVLSALCVAGGAALFTRRKFA